MIELFNILALETILKNITQLNIVGDRTALLRMLTYLLSGFILALIDMTVEKKSHNTLVKLLQ